MKTQLLMFFLIFSAFALSLNCQTKAVDEKAEPCKYLSFADAEKILGQPVRLIENISKVEGDVRKSDCVYRGISKDKVSGKDINLYFSLERKEQNPTVERARQIFESSYKKINEPDLSVQVLNGIGDEAFLISNPPNFHFMMVRKDEVIFRFKMNKAAENTSVEELKAFAKKVSGQI